MNRFLTVGLMSATLAACVSEPGPGSSSSVDASSESSVSSAISSSSITPSSSSSSSVVGTPSSSSVSSSSVAPQSSSSSVASSVASGFDGNAANGRMLLEDKGCTFCHADTDGDGYFNEAANNTPIDPDEFGDAGQLGTYDGASQEGIATFIFDEMASFANNYGGCDEQCTEDIAAYFWLVRNGLNIAQQEAALTVISCNANEPDDIHYGRRSLQVLKSYEYHNSLTQLFGAELPHDYSTSGKAGTDTDIARLPNHIAEQVSETRLNAYYDNAVELADWAMATPGALPFSCNDAVACSADFISEFAYVAYRRALSEAEQTEITDIFTGAADLQTGLKWALVTVLNSPQFLYRYELGTKVSDLLANPVVAPGNKLSFDGTPASESDITIPDYNSHSIQGHAWTGNDLIEIKVSGTLRGGGNPPVLTVYEGYSIGDGNILEHFTIDHTGDRTYYLEIDQAYTRPIAFVHNVQEAGGHDNGGNGTITISKLSYGKLGTVEPVEDDVASLMAADQNAYALDPYEYASALAFSLTGAAPSKALLDSAVAGELVGDASFDAHVNALIDSDMGIAHQERLAGRWFRTDGLVSKTRNDDDYTPEVRDSMMQEIREIYKHVFYNGDFSSMYSGDFTYLDSTLASFYGIVGKGGASHGDFQLVDTSGTARGGVIASGAYMTYNAHMDYSSPIQRGAHFRQDVLCQAIPQPNSLEDSDERDRAAERAAELAEAGTISTAEYFDIQTNVPGTSCAGCHNAILNPLFGMDDFDHVGRLRQRVNGDVVQTGLKAVTTGEGDNAVTIVTPTGQANVPIDFVNQDGFLFSPRVVGTLSTAKADADKEQSIGIQFSGAKDLGQKIVGNDVPGIAACLIEKTTRYAMGYSLNKDLLENVETARNLDTPDVPSFLEITPEREAEFVCVQDELEAAYAAANSPRDVLKAMVKSSAFRFRK